MVWKKIGVDFYEKNGRFANQFISVDKYPEGYAFSFGQARISFKFHKNKADAVKDMKKYMALMK